MSVKLWSRVALVMALAAGPAAAGSSPGVVPSAGGTITGMVIVDSTNASGIAVGTPVTGSYTYNPTVVQGTGGGQFNPFTSFSLTIGTHTFTQADFGQFTLDGRHPTQSNSTIDDLDFIFDQTKFNTAFGLPSTDPDSINDAVPKFNLLHETYQVSAPSGAGVAPVPLFQIEFVATPNATTTVPEPTGLTLAGLAVIGLALRARRRPAD
jgi:hypothetical protein